jgi:hypothetical protein
MFNKYPEFIDTDPRTDRSSKRSYNINQDFLERRYTAFFENIDLKDKTVLDLGCCVASLGAWVLDKGVKHYHGVEYDKKLCDISKKNLSKYFKNWTITQNFFEDFFINNSEKYDFIIASGVIYGYDDPSLFIDEITKISDNIILESRHPVGRWLMESDFGTEVYLPRTYIEMMEKLPLVVYYPSNAYMMYSDHGTSAKFNGSCPTKGFVDYYFDLKGYVNDTKFQKNCESKCPEIYNSTKRYACLYNKQNKSKTFGFKKSIENNEFIEQKFAK